MLELLCAVGLLLAPSMAEGLAPSGVEGAAGEEVRLDVQGLKESNLDVLAGKLRAIRARRSKEAANEEPVVKAVLLKDGKAVLALHEGMPLYLTAIDNALQGTDFKVNRKSLRFDGRFYLRISGMT